ncbi:XdhC family protein [Anaerocolumna aminovalerica]|uniref:XdhC/CoxI family protein n=1 Tax=Anaerocolumna aminovalerica TaxID=1527 RepID=UPI001C0EB1C2|nr:XdhC/CoxI family protein [Anaerocolumna aminovalerica]MBU5330830.1 XdhC family protein [Anaerocolumna aminovalerica]
MFKNIYDEVLGKVNNGEKACIVSSWTKKEGAITDLSKKVVDSRDGDLQVKNTLEVGIPSYIEDNENRTLIEPFYPEERLIILGGGHIAKPLVEFAAKIGFSITLIDDRLSFANRERFPLAKQVICDGFGHAIESLQLKESDYVIIITRGHRYDSDCLKAICKGPEPKYVGMIGSKRRTAIVKDNLEAEGCSRERLDRVHTPIGLNIGGITPEEISISIVAELIYEKRLGLGDKKQLNRSDFDYDVLKLLSEEENVPKALITVISAKGSVPRGAGAKMIVYPDGRIVGSVGGGCSEAAVIGDARRMIGTGTYKILDIDLTGDAAEEEGMVCGGIMTVLVEDYKGF